MITLFEDEAAPALGTNSAPSNPDNKTNSSHHFDAVKDQMGMNDDDFDAALSTGSITIWSPQDYSQKWGYVVSGPVQVDVNARPDGMYNVLFHLKDKKLMMPRSFILPYKDGEKPILYKGPVEDKMEVMSSEEIQKAMVTPFKNGGMPQGADSMGGMGGIGGPMGGMGGGNPMGAAGSPPMGGPMGGV